MYLPPVNVQARPPMAFFPIFPDSHGVYNSHLTFYGVIVVMGDFDQLPPVTGSALHKDLLRIENIKDTPTKSKMTNALSPDHPRYQLILHSLTTNKRSKDDSVHVARLDNIRDSSNPEPICD